MRGEPTHLPIHLHCEQGNGYSTLTDKTSPTNHPQPSQHTHTQHGGVPANRQAYSTFMIQQPLKAEGYEGWVRPTEVGGGFNLSMQIIQSHQTCATLVNCGGNAYAPPCSGPLTTNWHTLAETVRSICRPLQDSVHRCCRGRNHPARL